MNTLSDIQADDTSLSPTSQDGALESFITDFNRYETEAGLFEQCRDEQDFLWWDVARYAVQFAIATEKKLLGAQKAMPTPTFNRAIHFLQQMVRLGQLIPRVTFFKTQKIDALYLSTRKIEEASERILAENSRVLYINKTGTASAPHAALSKTSIDFLLRLLSPTFRVSSEVARDAARIARGLNDRFDTDIDLVSIILSKYKRARATFWFWERILSRLPALRQILFVNDDTLRPLVALAHKRGLETTEIQHGYMGRSHFAFSYPDLPFNLPTLADRVWVTRDTGDIVYPVPMGTLEKKSTIAQTTHRDIDVLIGSSPRRSEAMHQVVAVLIDAGLSVAVKLHPVETVESSGLQTLFPAEAVKVFAGVDDFVSLAARSRVFIPINPNSTTVFEAVEAGADLMVVHFDGHKITSMCDGIATAHIDSLDRLSDTVQNHLKRGHK